MLQSAWPGTQNVGVREGTGRLAWGRRDRGRGGAGRPLAGEAPPPLRYWAGRRASPGARPSVPCAPRHGPRCTPGSPGTPDPVSPGLLPPGSLTGTRVPQSRDPEGTPGTGSQPAGEPGAPPGRRRGCPCRGSLARWLSLPPLPHSQDAGAESPRSAESGQHPGHCCMTDALQKCGHRDPSPHLVPKASGSGDTHRPQRERFSLPQGVPGPRQLPGVQARSPRPLLLSDLDHSN